MPSEPDVTPEPRFNPVTAGESSDSIRQDEGQGDDRTQSGTNHERRGSGMNPDTIGAVVIAIALVSWFVIVIVNENGEK